jgi:hypothetical protein
MNHWETLYRQQLHHLNLLIDKQQPHEHNLVYALGNIPNRSSHI